MRSAELVGIAQTIACCGEIGGVAGRCEITKGRVWPLLVVIGDPTRDPGAGMVEAEEQALVEKLVAHAVPGAFFCVSRTPTPTYQVVRLSAAIWSCLENSRNPPGNLAS